MTAFVEHPQICGATTPIVEDNSVCLVYEHWNCFGWWQKRAGMNACHRHHVIDLP
jgi:hypothetical protein